MHDSMQDNIKMIEGAITKFDYQGKASIGMVMNANKLWSEENDGYFLDSGKKATEEDGLVSYLLSGVIL